MITSPMMTANEPRGLVHLWPLLLILFTLMVLFGFIVFYSITGIAEKRCAQCGKSRLRYCVHDFPHNGLGDRTRPLRAEENRR